jgi:hypothetical protein
MEVDSNKYHPSYNFESQFSLAVLTEIISAYEGKMAELVVEIDQLTEKNRVLTEKQVKLERIIKKLDKLGLGSLLRRLSSGPTDSQVTSQV